MKRMVRSGELIKMGSLDSYAVSNFKAELEDSICANASIGSLVNQTLKSMVRGNPHATICGGGSRATSSFYPALRVKILLATRRRTLITHPTILTTKKFFARVIIKNYIIG